MPAPRGAGVIFFEKAPQLTVLLFSSIRSGRSVVEELGGSVERGETAWKAAAREVREESCNLLNVYNPSDLPLCRGICYNGYQCWFLQLHSMIDASHYLRNRQRISEAAPYEARHWLETMKVVRVFWSDLFHLRTWQRKRGSFVTRSTSGEKVVLYNRTSEVLREFMRSEMPPTMVHLNGPTRMGDADFLVDTLTYNVVLPSAATVAPLFIK